jgi:hypothetical protein
LILRNKHAFASLLCQHTLIDTVSSRKFAELIKRGFELAIEYDCPSCCAR